MNNSPCCKRCETDDGYKPMCMIPSCPCHNSLCCERCRGSNAKLNNSGASISYFCTNSTCPCHSSSREKQEWIPREPKRAKIEKVIEAVVSQPSEAWEGKLSKIVKEQETFRASWGAFCIELRDFIRQKIAEAREDERNNTTGPGRTYQNGFEEGLAQGREDKITKVLAAHEYSENEGFQAGRTAALKKCLEVVEGMKKDGWSNFEKRDLSEAEEAHNAALSDLKQQITSLLK